MKRNCWKLLIAILLIAGCKKQVAEQEPPPPPAPEPAPARMIAIITDTRMNGTNTAIFTQQFIYDEQHRVKEIRESNNYVLAVRKVYTYLRNKVELRGYDNNGNPQANYAVDYYINEKGLVEEYRSDYNDLRIIYEYNDLDFLKKATYYKRGRLETYSLYHYGANNVLDSISLDSPTEKGNVTVYTYDRSKTNTVDNASKGMAMFGKSQPHPVTKESVFVYNLPGNTGRRLVYIENDYAHTYVNDSRIIHTNVRRTDYAYPGPVVTAGLYNTIGYTYQ